MRTLSDEALILEVSDLHDRDRIVAFITRHFGPKRGVARSARRRYSRFAGQLQPFAKVHVTWFERDDRELVRVRDAELLRPAAGLYEELEDLLAASYLAEHVKTFAPDSAPNELFYRLLDSSLDALRKGCDRELVMRYFETWALRISGIFPPPRDCPNCGADLTERGASLPRGAEALVCRECAAGAEGLEVNRAVLECLLAMGRLDLEAMGRARPAPQVLRRIEAVCREIRRGFLGIELRSYGVMERTLGALENGAREGPGGH